MYCVNVFKSLGIIHIHVSNAFPCVNANRCETIEDLSGGGKGVRKKRNSEK